MQYLFRFFLWFLIKCVASPRRLAGEKVSSEIPVCREAFIWTCSGIVSEVHSGLALPLLTVSIREGFEWTEVEPPVRCVLRKRRDRSRGAGIHGEKPRQTDRKKVKEGETKAQSSRAGSLFIDSHVCTNESLCSLAAGASRWVSSSAWLIDMTHLLAAEGC